MLSVRYLDHDWYKSNQFLQRMMVDFLTDAVGIYYLPHQDDLMRDTSPTIHRLAQTWLGICSCCLATEVGSPSGQIVLSFVGLSLTRS